MFDGGADEGEQLGLDAGQRAVLDALEVGVTQDVGGGGLLGVGCSRPNGQSDRRDKKQNPSHDGVCCLWAHFELAAVLYDRPHRTPACVFVWRRAR